MNFRTVKDCDFEGKRVLVRCDLDVPLDDSGHIQSDKRLRLCQGTLDYILRRNPKKLIIVGHIGRPKSPDNTLSTKHIITKLEELLNKKIAHAPNWRQSAIPENKIVLLENIRFQEGETNDDETLARDLASLADVYVNEAFAVSHRKHASVHAITKFLPSYAGLNLQHEIEVLSEINNSPKRPFYAIIGGSKLETKVPVIRKLLPKVDKILIGGGMIFSFYKTLGFEVGKSLVTEDAVALAKETLERSKDKIILPEDIVISKDVNIASNVDTVHYNRIPSNMLGVDIGPATIEDFKRILSDAKTIVWNGPMGVFEIEEFAKGTLGVAKILAELDATTIVGGGDSASAIEKTGLSNKFTHISSGGGASLELISGKQLPAIVALEENLKNSV